MTVLKTLTRRLRVPAWAASLLLAGTLSAQTSLQWDANGATTGVLDGSGTWSTVIDNWWTSSTNQAWNNAGNNIAVFGNGGALANPTAATVSVSGTVNVAGLQFNEIDLTSNTSNRSYVLAGSGTINIANGGLILFNDKTSNTVNGRITLSAALAGSNITLQKSGTEAAYVTISGSNAWTGTLTLANSGGGLFINMGSQAALSSLSSIDVQSGNTLVIGYTNATNTSVPMQLSGNGLGSRGAIRFDQNHTLAGAITLAADAAISVNTGGTVTGTVAGNIGETGGSRALTINSSTGILEGGTIVLSGNNTFTGGISLTAGTLRLGSAGALNASGVNLLNFTNSTTTKKVVLNGFSATVAGLAQVNATDSVTIENASATPVSLTLANTADVSFRGVLADGTGGGALTLVKNGTGIQALTGTTSTYTGGTVLNAGILRISGDGSLGAVPGAADADNLTFNGGTLQFSFAGSQASPSLASTRGITLLSGGGTLDTASYSTYYAGAITGAGNLTKNGTGLLILAGASDYSGETVVNTGTLEIRNALALGSTAGRTRLLSGARLDLSGDITVSGETLLTPYLASVSGNNTWTGTVQGVVGSTLIFEAAAGAQLNVSGAVNAADIEGSAHSVTLTGSGVGVLSGNFSNSLSLTKSGTGSWTLSGNNTFVNGIAHTQGELILGSYGAANASAPNTVTFSNNANTKILSLRGTSSIIGGLVSTSSTGVTTQNGGSTDAILTIQTTANRTYLGTLADGTGGGKLSLLKNGSATQVLGGANTYTGNTTVAAGTLQLDFAQTGAPTSQILSSSTALIMAGGTLSVTGSSTAANSQTVQSTTVAPGTSTISVTRHATTPQDVVLNLGAITAQNGGRVNFVLPSGTQSATNGIRTTTSNDASGILGGWATVGTDWATVAGGNIVAYTAYTDITNFSTGAGAVGPLPNNANANVRIVAGGTSGNIALGNPGATTLINTLFQSAAGAAVIDVPTGNTLRLGTSGGIMLTSGAGNLTIGTTTNSGILSAGGATAGTPGQLIFTDQTASQTITVNSAIRDNGSGAVSVVKNGPGLLVLGSTTNSNYSGGTFLYGGTIRISDDTSLGAIPGSVQSSHLNFNGGTLQVTANFTLNANRGILLQDGGGSMDSQTFTTTYNGIISGPGSLTKLATGSVSGSGTLVLGGANTYEGVTNLNVGTIQVNHAQALGSTANGTVVAAAAILRLNAGVTVTGETLTINGAGNNQGNLQVQSGTATWAGDIIIGNSAARIGTGNSTGILIIDGVIKNGAGSAISYVGNGGGVVVLKKANTYTGNSDIIRGTIRIDTDNALPTTTVLNMLTNTIVTETVSLELNGNDQTLAGLKHGVVSNVDNLYVTNSVTGAANQSVLTLNQAANTTYSGRIDGNLALVKDGSATLTLTNTYNNNSVATATQSTYTGKTTIRAGTLALSGTGNISSTPWIQVDQGATFSISGRTGGNYTLNNQILSGRGTVDGSLIIGGTSGYLSPGDSTGTLLTNAGNGTGELTLNNLTINGGTPTLRALFQIAGTLSNLSDPLSAGNPAYFADASSGGLYDSLQVNGTLGLNAGSTFKVTLQPGYTPQAGDVFNLLDWSSINLDADGAGGNAAFSLNDLDLSEANAALMGQGWYLNSSLFLSSGVLYVAMIPEPSRMMFLALGLSTLLMRRRRNK